MNGPDNPGEAEARRAASWWDKPAAHAAALAVTSAALAAVSAGAFAIRERLGAADFIAVIVGAAAAGWALVAAYGTVFFALVAVFEGDGQ